MFGSLRSYIRRHWRVLLFAAVATVATAVMAITVGVAGAAPVVVTALSALLLRAGATKTPRPRLELRVLHRPELWPATEAARSFGELFGGKPDTWGPAPPPDPSGVVVGRRRPLDVDAIVEDALRSVRAQIPGSSVLSAISPWDRRWAPPTEADQDQFETAVGEYADALRAWMAELDEYLTGCARLLACEVVQTNPAEVDATEARVVIHLPAAFEPVAELPGAPPAPTPPRFPRRRSSLSLAMQANHQDVPRFDAPLIASRLERPVAVSLWEPGFTRSGGALQIDYPRQTIRHGESEPTGDPFIVRCQASGEFAARWQVHAANLARPATGSWKLTCLTETTGDPVRSIYDLEEMLAALSAAEDRDEN